MPAKREWLTHPDRAYISCSAFSNAISSTFAHGQWPVSSVWRQQHVATCRIQMNVSGTSQVNLSSWKLSLSQKGLLHRWAAGAAAGAISRLVLWYACGNCNDSCCCCFCCCQDQDPPAQAAGRKIVAFVRVRKLSEGKSKSKLRKQKL